MVIYTGTDSFFEQTSMQATAAVLHVYVISSGGDRSLFSLGHKWGTITSKKARWSGSRHWGTCARRTAFGRAEVRDGVELYCEMRKTGAALTSDDGLPVGHR